MTGWEKLSGKYGLMEHRFVVSRLQIIIHFINIYSMKSLVVLIFSVTFVPSNVALQVTIVPIIQIEV